MKKGTEKTLRVVLGGLITAGLGYFIYNVFKRQPRNLGEVAQDTLDTIAQAPKNVSTWVSQSYPECGFPLKRGCGGENVKKLQAFLNSSGGYGLLVDGKFGNLTENAVIEEQKPFENFKMMYDGAKKGQITKEYFDKFIA